MTLDQALEKVAIGGSIEQTIWTQKPEGIEPVDGIEYQIRVVISKTDEDSHTITQHILAERQKVGT